MSKQAAEHLTTRGKKHPINKNLKGKNKSKIKALKEAVYNSLCAKNDMDTEE